MSLALILLFATAAGLSVGNLYYAQPLLGAISNAFHVTEAHAGLIATVTQLGYAAGLVLLVPLGDLFENRRLLTVLLGGTVLSLLAAAVAPSMLWFVLASLAIGVTSVVAQVLVPFAASLSPPARRGEVVGQVMSGLLLGILLARALAGLLSDQLGWRAVYLISAALMGLSAVTLRLCLPTRQPGYTGTYGALLRSLVDIYRAQPVLRRRAVYQAAMFGSFSAFWTCLTFLLSAPPFRFSMAQIGAVALVGALGATVAPLAGKLGDRGASHPATGAALALAALGFGLTLWQTSLVAIVVGACLLDLGVQMCLVLGQQAIYSLDESQRSRLNTLYISIFFLGGAVGSALASQAYGHGGWTWVVAIGSGGPLLAFFYWLTERRSDLAG
ncbi:MAG: MFS transporter [Candidatus Xenobia bacterium]